jgi:hypothetical protein
LLVERTVEAERVPGGRHHVGRRVARDQGDVSGSVKGHESDRHGKSHGGQRETADTPVL